MRGSPAKKQSVTAVGTSKSGNFPFGTSRPGEAAA